MDAYTRGTMRRGLWLIWLCLALLPLRGMAHGLMLGGGAAHGAAAVQAASDAALPCPMHDGAAGEAAAAIDGAATETSASPSAASCHLCGVCHGVALPVLAFALLDAEPPRSAPHAGAGLGAGRVAPDGLFRPPR